MGIKRGEMVIVVLHSPREKCWGRLDRISAAGVHLRGIDLTAFDDWLKALRSNEPFLGFTDVFFPLWRVERILHDERSGDVPSLTERFEASVGRSVREFLGDEGQ
ncbi:hypothetical protein [Pyrinomonas methylaliphatogenes]|uniref:Uncharacterized protein n=1 Tax=Pyrinomonas methylaliphatogenes TaxID=454194 RepID=A0A0B6WYF4_9BACT|nr:hypothetical protein [Pyrinomonas methylaliphatogenes]CDM66303.1 hypothetical protein PYK22_02330 [Pyrinomonas methylaliphatogenes]